MKVEALTLEKANQIIRQQEETKWLAEAEKGVDLVPTNVTLPHTHQPEVMEPLSLLVELPVDGGFILNLFERIGIRSQAKLYKAFNEKIDQIYQARRIYLDMLRQDDSLESIRRQRELSKIDHVIALKERRILMDYLNKIETSKKELILATITRMLEEHKSETRLQVAKATARAREYEEL